MSLPMGRLLLYLRLLSECAGSEPLGDATLLVQRQLEEAQAALRLADRVVRASAKDRATAIADGSSAAGKKLQCAPLEDPVNAACAGKVAWAAETGRTYKSAKAWYAGFDYFTGKSYSEGTAEDYHKFFFCHPPASAMACGAPPCSCSNPPCDVCFQEAANTEANGTQCAPLFHPNNTDCASKVSWAVAEGWNTTKGKHWYGYIAKVANVSYTNGTLEDYQRLFYCHPPQGGKACGLPPCSCTVPPCDTCPYEAPPWDPQMDIWGRRMLTEDEVAQSLDAEMHAADEDSLVQELEKTMARWQVDDGTPSAGGYVTQAQAWVLRSAQK